MKKDIKEWERDYQNQIQTKTEDGYKAIEMDKFEGYLTEKDKGVWISSIKSKELGKGNFSKLLKHLKNKYNWIKVPTPSNKMRAILKKKGFVSTAEFFPEPINEVGEVMLWGRIVKK